MIKVWSLPTRLLHWVLVCAFVVAFYTATSELKRDIHVDAGYVAGIVIILRWFYGFLMKDFSAFRRFPPNPDAGIAYIKGIVTGKAKRYLGHNPAGALAIYTMLTIGALTIITGYMSFNDIVVPFGLIDDEQMKVFHNYAAHAWLWVVGVHLVGVAVGCLIHRENLVLSMITGYKRRRLIGVGHYLPQIPARHSSIIILLKFFRST